MEQKLHEQKIWDDKVYSRVRQDLVDSVALRYRVRLQRQGEPHAGDWLHVKPNEHLGLRFGAAEYRLLLQFHLGIPLFPSEAAGTPCDHCGEAQDVFGDHVVACRHSGLWGRHSRLRDVVAAIAEVAGFRPEVEVSVLGRKRPADVLFRHWPPGQDAAVDLVVTHPLNHSQQWNGTLPAVEKAEQEKVTESAALCASANLAFIPLGVDTFGAYGSQGRAALTKLFSRYAKRLASEGLEGFPGQLQSECWQRVSVALHKGIGAQLGSVLLGGTSAPFAGSSPGPPLPDPPDAPRAPR